MNNLMENPENHIEEYTMGIGKANLFAFFLIIPITAVFLIPYLLIWDFNDVEIGRRQLMNFFFLVLVVGIVVHELLHGVGWALYAKKGFQSIRFGVNWKFLTPYCHCKEPLRVKHYVVGGALPLVVMGIIPSLTAIIIGNGFLLCFGIFFSWAAGGDIISLFMLRKINRETFVYDHPDKLGFYIKNEQIPQEQIV